MTNRTRLDSLRVGERFRLPGATTSCTVLERDGTMPGKTRVVSNVHGHIIFFNDTRMVIPLDPPPPVLTDEPGKVTKLTGSNSVQTALARKAPRTVYAHQIEPILELATTAAKAIADEDAIEYSTEDELDALTGALNLALKALGLPELNELAEE